jgi:hypothetical protein
LLAPPAPSVPGLAGSSPGRGSFRAVQTAEGAERRDNEWRAMTATMKSIDVNLFARLAEIQRNAEQDKLQRAFENLDELCTSMKNVYWGCIERHCSQTDETKFFEVIALVEATRERARDKVDFARASRLRRESEEQNRKHAFIVTAFKFAAGFVALIAPFIHTGFAGLYLICVGCFLMVSVNDD